MSESRRRSRNEPGCHNRVRERIQETQQFRDAFDMYRVILEDVLRYGPVGVAESEFRKARSQYRETYTRISTYLRPYTEPSGVEDFEALGNFGALKDYRLRDGFALLNALYRADQAIANYAQDLRELARAVG